jgi:hypothetical protein
VTPINHLKSFRQWKQLFRKVTEHLKIGGVFIFDMNTLSMFRSIHNKISVKKIQKGSSYGDRNKEQSL